MHGDNLGQVDADADSAYPPSVQRRRSEPGSLAVRGLAPISPWRAQAMNAGPREVLL